MPTIAAPATKIAAAPSSWVRLATTPTPPGWTQRTIAIGTESDGSESAVTAMPGIECIAKRTAGITTVTVGIAFDASLDAVTAGIVRMTAIGAMIGIATTIAETVAIVETSGIVAAIEIAATIGAVTGAETTPSLATKPSSLNLASAGVLLLRSGHYAP